MVVAFIVNAHHCNYSKEMDGVEKWNEWKRNISKPLNYEYEIQ